MGSRGMRWAWLAAPALLLALAGPAGAEAPQSFELSEDPDADQLCRAMAPPAFPEADRPTEEEVEKLRRRNCYSQLALHGIDQPLDVVRARQCAYAEISGRSEPDAVGGTEVLLTIYANGLGVPQNLELALAIACAHSATPELRAFRVRRLEAMRAGRSMTPLGACEGPLPRELEWECDGLARHIARARREDRRRAVEHRVSSEVASAVPGLFWAGRAFFQAYAAARFLHIEQLDLPLRADVEIQLEEAFLSDLEKAVEAPPAKRVVRREQERADRELEAALRAQRVASTEPALELRDEEQRRWLRYREEWVAFGRRLHPSVDAAVWRHAATLQRLATIRASRDNPQGFVRGRRRVTREY